MTGNPELVAEKFRGATGTGAIAYELRSFMPWIDKALKRMHRNLVAIALANKLARIAWAVLARGRTYQPRSLAHAA